MKYTYENERVIHSTEDVLGILFFLIWVCATLGVFAADGYLIVFQDSDGIGSPVLGGMFAVVTVIAGGCVYRSIQKRRKRALEMRHKAMSQGERHDGRITDAGVKRESVAHERLTDDNRTETFYRNEPNNWIDVAYFDPHSGHQKVFRAEHMSHNLSRFVGRDVDVYVWHEWSEYIHRDLTLTYIDTQRLG